LPGSKSAEKAARVSERKRIRNRSVKSAIKTKITKSEKFIAGSELESARAAVAETISDLDRAVKKGIIHRNTAGRRKSRLMKKLNQAPLTKPEEKKRRRRAPKAEAPVEAEVVAEATTETEAEK
jgi:small subunit ribosomal protein S20